MEKIDFKKEEREAAASLSQVKKYFDKKEKAKKKRETAHVRIGSALRDRVRNTAKKDKMSISKFMDKIIGFYYKHHLQYEEMEGLQEAVEI